MKSTDICPVCGPSSLVSEDGECAHCGATVITESVLRQIEAKQRERCAGICDVLGDEYAIARECARRIRGEK